MRTQKIINIKKIGKFNTLDLEVNHKDHNFYAEGLVTSNSHSCSYSYLSAITTYLKFNYPKEFFCSLLRMSKFEQDSHEEIRIIASELSYFGIELLPPDLIKSGLDFTIDGNNIRYGLSSIKGVSDKSIESLVSLRGKDIQNKFELFLSAKESGMNIGLLSSLIQAGALSGYQKKRSIIVLEAQVFNLLTDREKRNIVSIGKEYNFNLLNAIKDLAETGRIGDDLKKIISESRFETIKRNMGKYRDIYNQNSKYENFANWYFENHFLGYSTSNKLKDLMGEHYCDSLDLDRLKGKGKAKFVGTIVSTKKGKSRNQNKYLMMETKDEAGSIRFLLCDSPNSPKFSNYLEEGKKLPQKKDIVVISGSVSNDGKAVFVEDIHILTEKIYLKLSDLKD